MWWSAIFEIAGIALSLASLLVATVAMLYARDARRVRTCGVAAVLLLIVFAWVGVKSTVVHRRMEAVRLAALKFREENGAYPRSTGDLVPRYLEAQPPRVQLTASDESLTIQAMDVFGRVEEECSDGDCDPPVADDDDDSGASEDA